MVFADVELAAALPVGLLWRAFASRLRDGGAHWGRGSNRPLGWLGVPDWGDHWRRAWARRRRDTPGHLGKPPRAGRGRAAGNAAEGTAMKNLAILVGVPLALWGALLYPGW